MLRIEQLKLPVGHGENELKAALLTMLGIDERQLLSCRLYRQSLDARRKDRLCFIYSVDVELEDEDRLLANLQRPGISKLTAPQYQYPPSGGQLPCQPVIVGTGPAGLFAGLLLARAGHRPILLERGQTVEQRVDDVGRFFESGRLDPESNVQFGEGGAGTFSDGKLTTLINDLRCRKVLEEMVAAGAPPEILYKSKPHVGTDIIRRVVKNLRCAIQDYGGQFYFQHKVTGVAMEKGRLVGVVANQARLFESHLIVLAIGNSARDTFAMLQEGGVNMAAKPFSMGVRIEHPRELVDRAQWGRFAGHPALGAADYKLSHQCSNGYGAYTFCMCPGGVVVAATSEPGGVVTNGMSEFARNRPNSNSALMVGVGPAEFNSEGPLAGVAFQRRYERKAFVLAGGNYHAPVQLVGDFLGKRPSQHLGRVVPSYRPGVLPGDLRECLPDYVCEAIRESILRFDRQLKGFALPEAVLTGVETRSSSPLRIVRDEKFQSSVAGLFPAGEGAGYAGGIMSAATDGMKVAEAIAALSTG